MFKITIITLGNKMPRWVDEAVSEFSKRLQEFAQLNLIELPLIKRGKSNDIARIIEKESQLMNDAMPEHSHRIALAIDGKSFGSEELAQQLEKIQQRSPHLCLCIGGPEGLGQQTLARCDERWSLSKLTLPHTLARIVLLESLYRAFSININHPYHK